VAFLCYKVTFWYEAQLHSKNADNVQELSSMFSSSVPIPHCSLVYPLFIQFIFLGEQIQEVVLQEGIAGWGKEGNLAEVLQEC
jgi:hypothetical protein